MAQAPKDVAVRFTFAKSGIFLLFSRLLMHIRTVPIVQ